MNKLVKNLRSAILDSGLKDGMTISFHHHLRNGDYVLNMVLEEIAKLGIKDLTVNASAILDAHLPLIHHIKNGTVSRLETAYIGSAVGKELSKGLLAHPIVFRSHGSRTYCIANGTSKIHVAFIAASAADCEGNCTGRVGKSAFGGMGYAMADAQYADYKIVITDCLCETELEHPSICGADINAVVAVDAIGNPAGIVSSTMQITKSPTRLKIASDSAKAMKMAGVIKNGLKFQTGAGGISLAVTQYLQGIMQQEHVAGDYCLGGITGYMVEMLHRGYFRRLLDAQCFDQTAIESLNSDATHLEISCQAYASPGSASSYVNALDAVILGATEIDMDFNVNVHTDSFGRIMGGSGGHSDAAAGAWLTVVVAPLLRGRIPTIKEKVTTCSTPGADIDLFVTEYGISINPRRHDLQAKLGRGGLRILDIDEQFQIARKLCGSPQPILHGNKPVAYVLDRTNTLVDTIYSVKEE